MCLGSQKYKEAVDPSQAQLTPAPVIALFLAAFALLEWYKRKTTKRSPMDVQKCPGPEAFFLAVSIILLIHCAGTTAKPTCKMSILMKDRFGDETTVARVGGSLHVFCEGGSPNTQRNLEMETTTGTDTVPVTVGEKGELVIKIWNELMGEAETNLWEKQKGVFFGNRIRCQCGDIPSAKFNVPQPVLCSAGSQLVCGNKTICSLDGERKEVCTEANSPLLCGAAKMKTKTSLCPRKDHLPLQECWNVRSPVTAWPQFEVPESDTKMCKGSLAFLPLIYFY